MTTIPWEQICDFITAQSLYRPLLDFWVEIKKKCYWNCCPGPANGLVQPIGRHPLSCQYPLITNLGIFLTWTSLSKLQSATRWASFNLIITISSINYSKAYPSSVKLWFQKLFQENVLSPSFYFLWFKNHAHVFFIYTLLNSHPISLHKMGETQINVKSLDIMSTGTFTHFNFTQKLDLTFIFF